MRVMMNECRVPTTEKQFPRTHGQVSNTYCLLLPSRKIKSAATWKKNEGLTHKADSSDEFSLTLLSQTEHFKTFGRLVHLSKAPLPFYLVKTRWCHS